MNAPTLDQALDALARMSPDTLTGGPYHCPWCDPNHQQDPGLHVNQNGTGPHYDCQTGTPATGCDPTIIERFVIANARAAPITIETTLEDETRAQLHTLLIDKSGKHLTVARIIKQGRYVDIQLEDGRVAELGTAAQMLNRRQFEANILDQLDVLIEPLKVPEHRQMVAGMVAVAERREIATTADETLDWINGHLNTRRTSPVDLTNPEQLRDLILNGAGRPFRTPDGAIGVTLAELRSYITNRLNDKINQADLSTRLGRLGFTKPSEGGQLSARQGGKVAKQRYWISPPGFEDRL